VIALLQGDDVEAIVLDLVEPGGLDERGFVRTALTHPTLSAYGSFLAHFARTGSNSRTRASGRTGAFKALCVNDRSSRLCYIPSTVGLFGQGAPRGAQSGSSRGETGKDEEAGKIAVMTLAALPRNPVNAVKSMTWRRFLLWPCRKEAQGEPVERSAVEGIYFPYGLC
jgi:hypothetical protein